jgi:hypothetical protein
MQTKLQSVSEAAAGTVFAFITGVLVGQYVIYPLTGVKISLAANIHATVWFTVVSMIRSYGVRRFFNWFHSR